MKIPPRKDPAEIEPEIFTFSVFKGKHLHFLEFKHVSFWVIKPFSGVFMFVFFRSVTEVALSTNPPGSSREVLNDGTSKADFV